MKRCKYVLCILLACMLSACSVHVTTNRKLEDHYIPIAKGQLQEIMDGEYEVVANQFDTTLANEIGAKELQDIWEVLNGTLGEHVSNYSIGYYEMDTYTSVELVEEFTNNGLKCTFNYNDEDEIVGIYFNYYEIIKEYETNEDYNELGFEIGETYPLDGILTLPEGVEHPPVVLFVHGSGPLDLDSSIGETKLFDDLAKRLAENGIASVRYNKRYFSYPQLANQLGSDVTLENEVLEDVQYALTYIQDNSIFDQSDIYVLGHSMGGGLTPYIASINDEVDGIISMAGSLRPLYELSYDQNKALEASILSGDNETLKAQVRADMQVVEEDIEVLRNTLDSVDDDTILMGLPAKYQKSAKQYAGENYISSLTIPILVLQGDADFQVIAEKEIPIWQEVSEADITIHSFGQLNHLLMPTSEKQDMSEYDTPAHVDYGVIEIIVDFIK